MNGIPTFVTRPYVALACLLAQGKGSSSRAETVSSPWGPDSLRRIEGLVGVEASESAAASASDSTGPADASGAPA